jgi:hypothetical protein
MSPRVVGEDANIDGIYVPPDKKTKECSPDHFEPKLDTGVF